MFSRIKHYKPVALFEVVLQNKSKKCPIPLKKDCKTCFKQQI